MRNPLRQALVVFLIGACVEMSPAAQAGSVGPYYATPSWDQTLPVAARFILLSNFNNRAFLDRNTGLVWATDPLKWGLTVSDANEFACQDYAFGEQYGWRLSTFRELLTLLIPYGDTMDDPSTSNYAQQLPVSFIHYPPRFEDGFTHILAAKHSSTYRILINQTDTDWAVFTTANGADVLSHSYIWCVRGPGDNP